MNDKYDTICIIWYYIIEYMIQTSGVLSMDKRKELNQIVKESIAQSVFLLMEEKPFSDITITEIIQKAGVARASFYRNFSYKEEAIRYYLVEKMKQFKLQHKQSGIKLYHYEAILNTMQFVINYKHELKSLFTAGLSQILLEAINTYLFDVYPVETHKAAEKYILYSYGGSLFNIIYHWVSSGLQESPEEIAQMICA